MDDDKRRELKEAYESLSRSEKAYLIAYALSRIIRHRIKLFPFQWVLIQIQIDLKLEQWKSRLFS